MDYTLTATVDAAYDDAVVQVREALAEQGFGVLTEIDIQATLRAKLGVEVAPQVILGACRPPLAHAALQADPSIAALLPCNVVVRAAEQGVVVEAIDPDAMMSLAGGPAVREVAADAKQRLTAALAAVASRSETRQPDSKEA
ncbi:MAG: DUF302 domain-containing protein [Nocardioides sp.]|uniref:DUF302 domain-containing protein n=1 Tax=Nocardioides sp. TaxID=35761 RepID=UPI0039E5E34F